MFTGIITHQGTVISREALSAGVRLRVQCALPLAEIPLGASIACDGACMTVVEKTVDSFLVEVSEESLNKTTMGDWQAGRKVNLERPVQAGGEFGGHFVTGHVDAVASVKRFDRQGDFWLLEVNFPPEFQRFFAEKGSVTLNGVSLTVNTVAAGVIGMTMIPHTAQITNLGALQKGDKVNLEVDLIARYIAPYLAR